MNQPSGVRPDPGLALLDLYEQALPQVYGYLLARCGQRAVAEDLTTEVFLAAMDSCRRGKVTEVATSWLIGIARHKLVDHWRRAERERRGLRVLGGLAASPDDPWDERLDALLAHQMLAELSAQHRSVLTLRYLDGLPVPEVARCLDRTVHATEALLVRARGAFRTHYQRREEGTR